MTTTDFVPVMVPKDYVMEVYALIVELSDVAPPGAQWDAELAERSWNESSPAMKRLLRHLAETSGQWTLITDLARVVDPDEGRRSILRSVLAAWSRRCRSRYEVETWPFEARWDQDLGMWKYQMLASCADLYQPHFD